MLLVHPPRWRVRLLRRIAWALGVPIDIRYKIFK